MFTMRPSTASRASKLVGLALACAMGLFGQVAAQEQSPSPYRVGPGDQLRITTYGEPQLSGMFKVNPDGCISFPLVGSVSLVGKTLDETLTLLRAQLGKFVPIGNNLTVDVGQYANVYVMGDIEKAGAQEYRPGMIVTELVALAGGFRKGTREDTDVVTRLLTVEQDVRDERLKRFADLVQRARLQAETSGSRFDKSSAPSDASIPPEAVKRIVADEVALYGSRQHALGEQRAALERQSDAFNVEIDTLNQSVGLHENEIKLIQGEIDTQVALVDKGIATQTKLQGLRRELAGALRLSLDIRASLARAKQGQLEIAQKVVELATLRASENSTTLRDLDVTLGRADQSIDAKLSIADELRGLADKRRPLQRGHYVYSVLRAHGGRRETRIVSEVDELKPDDILRVDAEPGEGESRLSSLSSPE